MVRKAKYISDMSNSRSHKVQAIKALVTCLRLLHAKYIEDQCLIPH